ncbi:MAG: hypothetical protein ING59_10945 [Burkholderiales bacterium]|nr:hypothetical protein [Burkholderiales bacterium]
MAIRNEAGSRFRVRTVVAALVLGGTLQVASAGPLEDALDRRVTSLTEVANLLATIRDLQSAQGTLPQLDAAIARNRSNGQQVNSLMQGATSMPPAAQQALVQRVNQLQAQNVRIMGEIERLQRLPGMPAVIGNRGQLALE